MSKPEITDLPDFFNIAYNLMRAGHTEGIFSPSDRDGVYRYKQLVDGRYRFRDAKSGHEVCIVTPRAASATPHQEAQTVAPTREDLLARVKQLEDKLELNATQAGNALRRYDALSTLLEQYTGHSLSHDEKVLTVKSLIATARLAAEEKPPCQ